MDLTILTFVGFFLVLLTAITWFGYSRYARAGQAYTDLGKSVRTISTSSLDSGDGKEPTMVRVIQMVGELVPVSPEDVSMTRRYLIAAGFRNDSALIIYACLLYTSPRPRD